MPVRVHVIIPTHTPRHLAACLRGLALQAVQPASVAVASDTDDPAIGDAIDIAELPQCPVLHSSRKHQGWAHPAQVRNNAVRALDEKGLLKSGDLLLGIDGDIVLTKEAIQEHARLAAGGAELIIAFRMCLAEDATRRFEAGEVDDPASLITPQEIESLAKRDLRYKRQLAMRAVPLLGGMLVKSHKPKLISAHYAVSLDRYREVNGFDEEYKHYGYEDDDLGRRLHAAGARCAIAVALIPAVHLWHVSRAPTRPMDAPGYARFSTRTPTRAVRGLDNGLPQPAVSVRVVRS